ncbi:MAG TPA: sensor histidine kinase [Rhizomicrobium sp.]|jgi:two-component sensor histidine kinase|nr:sensor histidine kinase [Rhizomicrobium sp.]
MSVNEVQLGNKAPPPNIDMLREANHRISNHLTLLAGMVQTQAGAVGRGPESISRDAARAMLQETAGKIVSVGHLHRRLSEQPHRGEINLCDYLVEACATLVSSLSLGERVSLVQRLSANCLVAPEQAQQIGLMVSEIIMNAVKHAHPTGIPVQIALACRRETDGRLTIEIGDDGVGLPEGSEATIKGGVGFKLIRALAQALTADLRIESDSLGLTFLITLPAAVQAVGIAAR